MNQISDPKRCRIIIDAMGGDYAPRNTVLGAVQAHEEDNSFDLLLIGKKEEINKVLKENGLSFNSENIIDAPEIIEMSETPTNAIKNKKQSSIVIGAEKVLSGEAHAFVSAGNTGAMMAASTLIMGRIPGVGRPTIGAPFPTENGTPCTVYDVGASVDSKPRHLLEYAVMGDIFVREIYGIENPKIGLLSVGEEESKGSALSLAAYKLLKETKLNFAGNVEGRDILNGKVDIVICDGFVGNIMLKFAESFMGLLKSKIKTYSQQGLLNKLKALTTRNTLRNALKDMDYQTHGGVPLIGVKGISIIGHGSSSPLAIKNMALRAKEMYDKNLLLKFEETLKGYTDATT